VVAAHGGRPNGGRSGAPYPQIFLFPIIAMKRYIRDSPQPTTRRMLLPAISFEFYPPKTD